MSDLIAVGFKGEDTADQMLNKLQALQKEHLIDLEDACVVDRGLRRTTAWSRLPTASAALPLPAAAHAWR